MATVNASIPRPLIALVAVAVVVVLGYDGVRIGMLRLSADDDAHNAAFAGANAYHREPNVLFAYQAAQAVAQGAGGEIAPADFSVSSDGHVTLTLTDTTTTLILGRLHKQWLTTSSSGTAVWVA